ncbi:MAG: hypothetical protein Q8S73_03820 [Deltaproteobacteria bacterium]|nr:hypothetical protein [Myxococcales bacterium]MDP3213208.1 hypothetical protein [Deltaproteobacteria bacterium]
MRPLARILPLVGLLALSCSGAQRPRGRNPDDPVPVLPICLAGEAAARGHEYSGLAWHNDELFLLPQWSPRGLALARAQPGFTQPWLYRIPGARLRAWIDGRDRAPITPERVPIDLLDLAADPDYQGFEAIDFDGDRAALVVERGDQDRMSGLLVTARLDPARGLVLDRDALTLDVPLRSDNHAFEALTRVDGAWLALFEANGMNTSCASTALRVEGREARAVAVEAIPYRVTDASAVDASRQFWVTQYSYREVGDTAECERTIRAVGCFSEAVDCDPRGGAARSVERLLELRDDGVSVRATGRVIRLAREERGRNWEGLVRLDDKGFLLVTDEWPSTVLGYVPSADQPLPPPAPPCPPG